MGIADDIVHFRTILIKRKDVSATWVGAVHETVLEAGPRSGDCIRARGICISLGADGTGSIAIIGGNFRIANSRRWCE